MRAVIYSDHRGGYINNVPSTFTRMNNDLGNYYARTDGERPVPQRSASDQHLADASRPTARRQ